MFEKLQRYYSHLIRICILRSLGWKRRHCVSFGQREVEWKHPVTGLWYRETTAIRIINVMAFYRSLGCDSVSSDLSEVIDSK